MKFSDVVGLAYHQIRLTSKQSYYLDIHFSSAAWHLFRYREAKPNSEEEKFHDCYFRKHLYKLMEIVYTCGDFREAYDSTGLDLHLRTNWNPEKSFHSLPDPRMFSGMPDDHRYKLGNGHPGDRFLYDT